MRRFAGSCRFVFNKALALQRKRYEQGRRSIGYAGLCKAAHRVAQQRGNGMAGRCAGPSRCNRRSKDLERAYSNFFAKRADFPRFKKKPVGTTASYPDPKQIKLDQTNSRMFLPKLGWLRYRNSRDILGENCAMSPSVCRAAKWFVSIQTERGRTAHPQRRRSRHRHGHCPVRHALGRHSRPLNSFKRHETALRKAQQTMSRKVKFSTTGRRRKPASRRFIAPSAMPAATTCTRPQPRSAKTTRSCALRTCRCGICPNRRQAQTEAPGRGTFWAKSGLNKAILDQAGPSSANWTTSWRGMAGHLIAVPPQNTAGRVRAAAMCRRTIARHKPSSSVWNAVLRKTPMSSARSTY